MKETLRTEFALMLRPAHDMDIARTAPENGYATLASKLAVVSLNFEMSVTSTVSIDLTKRLRLHRGPANVIIGCVLLSIETFPTSSSLPSRGCTYVTKSNVASSGPEFETA